MQFYHFEYLQSKCYSPSNDDFILNAKIENVACLISMATWPKVHVVAMLSLRATAVFCNFSSVNSMSELVFDHYIAPQNSFKKG